MVMQANSSYVSTYLPHTYSEQPAITASKAHSEHRHVKKKNQKPALACSIIKRHVQPGGVLGPNHTAPKSMSHLFGSTGIPQPKQSLKCCVALLASTWIADLTYVGTSCVSSPSIRNKVFRRRASLSGKRSASQ